MNGGYIMIYKNSKKIYSELFACLTLGKPILWYEDKNTCFFIDTISGGEVTTEIVDDEEVTTYGDIILTKGGMTITITSENVVTEVGDIQPVIPEGEKLYQHFIKLNFPVPYQSIVITLLTNDATPFTKDTLRDYLYSRGYTNSPNTIDIMIIVSDGTNFYLHRTLWATSSTISVIVSPVGTTSGTQINAINISDNVLPL